MNQCSYENINHCSFWACVSQASKPSLLLTATQKVMKLHSSSHLFQTSTEAHMSEMISEEAPGTFGSVTGKK